MNRGGDRIEAELRREQVTGNSIRNRKKGTDTMREDRGI